MQNTYKTDYVIRYSDIDCNYNMRPDVMVSLFQDITTAHSSLMGIDGDNMRKNSNAFWVITKMKLKFGSFPIFNNDLQLETWPTTVDKVRFGRDYAIYQNGKKIVCGTSEWCTLDIDTKALRRTDSIAYPKDMPHRSDLSGAGNFIKQKETITEDDFCFTHRSAFTDIDTNKHTNNVAYVRMMLDTFTPEEYAALLIDEIQISFISQSFYGDSIRVYRRKTDYGYYIEGKLEGKNVFNGFIKLKNE